MEGKSRWKLRRWRAARISPPNARGDWPTGTMVFSKCSMTFSIRRMSGQMRTQELRDNSVQRLGLASRLACLGWVEREVKSSPLVMMLKKYSLSRRIMAWTISGNHLVVYYILTLLSDAVPAACRDMEISTAFKRSFVKNVTTFQYWKGSAHGGRGRKGLCEIRTLQNTLQNGKCHPPKVLSKCALSSK